MKKHILLIDDDEDELSILTAALYQIPLAFDCMWVKNADHALRLLQNYTPDYIFIDYNMPKMNGIKCLEEIKKLENLHETPVILYTTSTDEENRQRAMSIGATAYMQKPNALDALLTKLKDIFGIT
jgi:DNA-binding response OmpR family regulator